MTPILGRTIRDSEYPGRTPRGVPPDIVLAHMWWNLAAAQGNETAKKNRDKAASQMTPDQLAEAQRLAREWKGQRRKR